MDRAEIEQLVRGELAASRSSLSAATNNLAGPRGPQYRSCVAELYFACFHMATALLASKGIRARSHDAMQELLALHFVKPTVLPADTTRRFGALMELRHTADYKTYAPVEVADVEEFRPWVLQFLASGLRILGKSSPEAAAKELHAEIAEFGKHGTV